MNTGFIMAIISMLIAVGSVVVAITTKINHIDHIEDKIDSIDGNLKDVWKEINKIKEVNKEEIDRISRIEGRLNGM